MLNWITVVLAVCFTVFTLPAHAADISKTKTISYRGGIVTFTVPQIWHEEYEPDGGAIFYEDHPDAGTLRLSVISYRSKSEPAQKIASSLFPAGSYEVLANGFPLRYEVKDGAEDGEKLKLHFWSVGFPVPPDSARIALFSYTIVAGQEHDPRIVRELAFLNKSIRSAVFSTAPGVAGPNAK